MQFLFCISHWRGILNKSLQRCRLQSAQAWLLQKMRTHSLHTDHQMRKGRLAGEGRQPVCPRCGWCCDLWINRHLPMPTPRERPGSESSGAEKWPGHQPPQPPPERSCTLCIHLSADQVRGRDGQTQNSQPRIPDAKGLLDGRMVTPRAQDS